MYVILRYYKRHMAFYGGVIMSTTHSIVALWGGSSILGGGVQGEEELISLLRRGLPFAALERTMEAFSLSREEVGAALSLPARTLVRRKQTQQLAAAESDRLYRLSRILAHAENVLGGKKQAAQWLHRANRALNGAIPMTLLDTEIGATQVDDVLGRLEHGVFS